MRTRRLSSLSVVIAWTKEWRCADTEEKNTVRPAMPTTTATILAIPSITVHEQHPPSRLHLEQGSHICSVSYSPQRSIFLISSRLLSLSDVDGLLTICLLSHSERRAMPIKFTTTPWGCPSPVGRISPPALPSHSSSASPLLLVRRSLRPSMPSCLLCLERYPTLGSTIPPWRLTSPTARLVPGCVTAKIVSIETSRLVRPRVDL